MVQVGNWEVAAGGNASVYKGTLRLKNGAKKLVRLQEVVVTLDNNGVL
jgi:hypothetical protein